MSYSRRQLYAAGEPLGESVTRKENGRVVFGDGGGGGGSSAPATQTNISEIPEWARGYAKDTLAKTAAVTDVNQNPYQTYGGDRIAGFSPMQQQAQQQAAGMQTSGATGMGTGIAGAASLGALGANYDPTQFQTGQFGQQQANQYMSPYMQNVVDVQQQEAQRQSDIAGTGRNAQATAAGAFGGSRQAIMDAEAARNLATQKGSIQATGLQNAYSQAQQQFNADQARQMQAQQGTEQSKQYGAGYGMQGLQTALQGAGQLGTLGGQQFQQGMDINKLQSAYGGQEQALQQTGLDTAYQNFQNQQNYPYKQLGFMSDMIRGLPLGQQSTTQMYAAPTTAAQTAATVGMAGYGLSKFMADGGAVKGYAGGGGVDSQDNVDSILSKLSPQQLDQAIASAQARGDMTQMQAAQSEKGFRASMERGIAGAVTPKVAAMAGGGVIAFAGGGSPYEQSMQRLKSVPEYVPPTAEESQTATKAQLPGLQSLMGESKTAPYMEEVKAERAKRKDAGSEDKDIGAGLLHAAAAMSQGRNLTTGIGAAAAAFGDKVTDLRDKKQKADDLLRASEIQLATADQTRADGMVGKAAEQQRHAETMKQSAAKMAHDVAKDEATIAAGIEHAKISAAAVLGKQTFEEKSTEAKLAAAIAADPSIAKDPAKLAAAREEAFTKTARETRTASYTGEKMDQTATLAAEKITAAARAKALEHVDIYKNKDPAWKAAKAAKNPEAMLAREKELVAQRMSVETPSAGATTASAPIKISNKAEFDKLPSGTTFVAPDGSTRIKP